MSITARFKRMWTQFGESKPGHRFQDYYERHREETRSPARRIASVAAGILIMAVGLVALPAPGPGTIVIAIGGALLAREFLVVARAMDWIELRGRRAVAWIAARFSSLRKRSHRGRATGGVHTRTRKSRAAARKATPTRPARVRERRS